MPDAELVADGETAGLLQPDEGPVHAPEVLDPHHPARDGEADVARRDGRVVGEQEGPLGPAADRLVLVHGEDRPRLAVVPDQGEADPHRALRRPGDRRDRGGGRDGATRDRHGGLRRRGRDRLPADPAEPEARLEGRTARPAGRRGGGRRLPGGEGLAAVEAEREARLVLPAAARTSVRRGHSPAFRHGRGPRSTRPGAGRATSRARRGVSSKMRGHARVPRVPEGDRGRGPVLSVLRRRLDGDAGRRRSVDRPGGERQVPDRGDARAGRDGQGLPGQAPDPRPRRRPQDAPPRPLRRPAGRPAVPARGPRRLAPQPPELHRRPRLRRRRGRDAVHGDGVPLRARPRPDHRGRVPARRGAHRPDRRAGALGARRGPRPGHRPPRSQARERDGRAAARRARLREGARLRHREDHRPRRERAEAHAGGARLRHARNT